MIWNPPAYCWPNGSSSAACFSIDVDATSPYLWQHRDRSPNGLAILEHRQYGMRQGLSRIVKMLDCLGVKGSFFVPGIVAKENPDLLPGLLSRGHEIALHGYYHEIVGETQDQRFSEALEASIDIFKVQTGQKPVGFRSPAWEMTPHMLTELAQHGLWDSSLMGSDTPYNIQGVTEVPVRWDNDDAIFFKFLGAGDTPPRSDREIFQKWQNDAAAQARSNGLFMLTIHDWISGRAVRVEMLEALFKPIVADPSIWIATCGELAEHHRTLKTSLEVTPPLITPINQRDYSNE